MSETFSQTTYLVFADLDGDVQLLNAGRSDNGAPIFFELETQEQELGNRATWKQVSNQIGVMGYGLEGTNLSAREDDGEPKPIPILLDRPVSIGDDIALTAHWITFRWSGSGLTTTPVLEGIYLEDWNDVGLIRDIT